MIIALWGLSHLLIGVIYGFVLWLYQALIPSIYLLLVFEYGMRFVLGAIKPIETIGTPPGAIGNYIISPLAIIMLVLSLRNSDREAQDA